MIEFHRLKQDELSEEIEKKLKDMVLAYKTFEYDERSESELPLPFIRENDQLVSEESEIRHYLQELESELQLQRSVTGDGCYIDPASGKIC
ncbi:MAG: hypothetical protein WD355_09490 [Balneolaceae bacterium]